MKKSRDIRSGQKNELLRWLVYIPNETHYESGFRPEQDPITHGKRLNFGLKVLKLSGKIEAHQKTALARRRNLSSNRGKVMEYFYHPAKKIS
jgi:hypothetical protein